MATVEDIGAHGPSIDPGARDRLATRFGERVLAWLDDAPGVLVDLAGRWGLELGEPIPRGSVSVVFRARGADGRRSVLKLSPDMERLALEAAALEAWDGSHTPAVLAVDTGLGAMLLEAIRARRAARARPGPSRHDGGRGAASRAARVPRPRPLPAARGPRRRPLRLLGEAL